MRVIGFSSHVYRPPCEETENEKKHDGRASKRPEGCLVMKFSFFVTGVLFICVASAPALAKGPTTRITIENPRFTRPIVITDAAIIKDFQVFAGPGNMGYVYLPGREDRWYGTNVCIIYRRLEGNWFRVLSRWEDLARPMIEKQLGQSVPTNSIDPVQKTPLPK